MLGGELVGCFGGVVWFVLKGALLTPQQKIAMQGLLFYSVLENC